MTPAGKKLMKEKKWSEAIQHFRALVENQEDQCDVDYKDLARCLRIEGEFDEALAVLERGIERFPESTALYSAKFSVLTNKSNWEAAKDVAEVLIELEPNEGKHYFKLGRSYNFLKNADKAAYCFKLALEKMHDMNIEDIAYKVKGEFDFDNSFRAKYVFVGGKNNLGGFEHKEEGMQNPRTYITKINFAKKKNKEKYFYTTICEKYPQLKNISPKLINFTEFNETAFLTMEKVDGGPPNKSHVKRIVQSINQNMASIEYSDISQYVTVPNYLLTLKEKRSQSVLHFFSSIEKQSTNERLFMLLKKRLSDYQGAAEMIERLEDIIVKCQLYEKVSPESHYALLHGDLGSHNIIIENGTNRPYIIDWNSYTIGPAGFDSANLFVKLKLTFREIKMLYLCDSETGGKMENIEKIFFIYALLVIWLQSVSKKKFEAVLINNLLPAIEYLQILAEKEVKPEQGRLVLQQREKMLNVSGHQKAKGLWWRFTLRIRKAFSMLRGKA